MVGPNTPACAGGIAIRENDPMSNTNNAEEATAEIRGHVEALFDAFLAKDRAALRNGRVEDWRGFQIPSTTLIRGVDDYMVDLETALQNVAVTRYEFLDFEVDVRGDVALVYYVARDWLNTPQGETTILVRALDVYGLEDEGWIQIGSNICLVPDTTD
jgi:ketosteroid isomerase-like protein